MWKVYSWVAVAALSLTACGAGTPTPAEQAEVSSFGGQQAVCHATTNTRADEDRCRDATKSYWCGDGGALSQANACADVHLSDGGKP